MSSVCSQRSPQTLMARLGPRGWLSAGLLLGGLALGACQVRSISDPGLYRSSNRLYEGELREMDIVGGDPSDRDPATARRDYKAPRLARGSRVLLIQSGALIPDPELLAAFGNALDITTMSGIPNRGARQHEPADALRLAAAAGGIDAIVCVWGMLETKIEDRDSKAVSWIPVLGWSVRDEVLDTRIRLRFVIVDVRSGSWESIQPEPVSDVTETSPADRNLGSSNAEASVRQVERLKKRSYPPSVRAFLQRVLAQ